MSGNGKGAHPLRLFGTKQHISLADSHLQSYCCSVVRGILEEGLSRRAEDLDGMVFPHTCDAMQRLSDIWRMNIPFGFHLDVTWPSELDTESARDYLKDVLEKFRDDLGGKLNVEISDDALQKAPATINAIRLSDADEKRYRISPVSLEDLLKTSDVISLHCPLTDETNGLLGRDNLALLKPGAVIINVARGEVIDEAALAEALRAGKIGGAALDVFCGEPINASHPLVGAAGDKVILTPHIAGVSQEAQGRILTITIDNIIRVMRGREPENKVN